MVVAPARCAEHNVGSGSFSIDFVHWRVQVACEYDPLIGLYNIYCPLNAILRYSLVCSTQTQKLLSLF